MSLQQEIQRSAEARYDHRLHGVLLVARGMTCPEVGRRLRDLIRRPAPERTSESKIKAVSYAAYDVRMDMCSGPRPFVQRHPRIPLPRHEGRHHEDRRTRRLEAAAGSTRRCGRRPPR